MKLIFPISFILISGLLFFAVVNPLYGNVRVLRSDVTTYNTALDHSKELETTRDSLVDTYKNITEGDKDRLLHFLPNTVNNIRFILEIEQIANLHSMPIKNIKFDPGRANIQVPATGTVIASNDPSLSKPYGVFPIEFTTEGNYETFALFLKDMEHNLRLVDVKSVSFSVPPTQAGVGVDPNIYTYTLKVETYWLK